MFRIAPYLLRALAPEQHITLGNRLIHACSNPWKWNRNFGVTLCEQKRYREWLIALQQRTEVLLRHFDQTFAHSLPWRGGILGYSRHSNQKVTAYKP